MMSIPRPVKRLFNQRRAATACDRGAATAKLELPFRGCHEMFES